MSSIEEFEEEPIWDFILDLSCERIWFGSVYATNMMLTKFDKYSKTQTGDYQSIFLRKLSCWHEKTLIPTSKKIAKKHNVPDIFKPVFLDETENFFTKDDVCGLHLYLLLLTSKHLLVQCQLGLGPVTTHKVKEWFKLMRFVLESSLFQKCSTELKNEFCKTFQIFNEGESFIENEEEHEYFDPHLVFIHLSHLVVFYTKSSIDFPQSKHLKMESSQNAMNSWQTLSGQLFEKVFQLESHGLQVLDESNYTDRTFCYSVKFPYYRLGGEPSDEKPLTDSENLPSMFTLLFDFFNQFEDSINKIGKDASKVQWTEELHKLHDILHFGNTLNNSAKELSYKREKARRNYRRNTKSEDAYKPRLPLIYQRDEYCLGCYSYSKYALLNQTACKKRKHEGKVTGTKSNTSQGLSWRSPGFIRKGNFLDSDEETEKEKSSSQGSSAAI